MSAKTRRWLLRIGGAVLVIGGLLAVILPTALRSDESHQIIVSEAETVDQLVDGLWTNGTIEYQGEYYRYNTGIKTYLLMGIDNMDEVEEIPLGNDGHRGDALFLLVVDSNRKTWSVIGIDRNLMTDVMVYSEEGEYLGIENLQICLGHEYGDGATISCENQVWAVSNCFWNLPIDGYLAMNMGAISIMNDAIGGVVVTTNADIYGRVGMEYGQDDLVFPEGMTVKLSGDDAMYYLRFRDMEGSEGASERLDRQMTYLKSAYNQLLTTDVNKLDLAQSVLDVISNYTLMDDVNFAQIAYAAFSYGEIMDNFYTIPGENTLQQIGEDSYLAEYHMDEEATMSDIILQVYYHPVSEDDL